MIKIVVAFVIAASFLIVPFQGAFALNSGDAQDVVRGSYYDLPQTVKKYVSSGKTLEFDLNTMIASSDVCKLGLYDGNTMVSSEFFLRDGEEGLSMAVTSADDGWYHYAISFATVPHSEDQEDSSVTRFRVRSTFPSGTKIKNISIGADVRSLPEAFTEDYDTVTLADLGLAGTDYKTSVSSGTYEYNGKSKTKSVIVKFGWKPKFASGDSQNGWRIALDTYWNQKAAVWFREDGSFAFFPSNDASNIRFDAVDGDTHNVEFGRLRVVAGPNYGKDYVFIKIDGDVKASVYTDYYQTKNGYEAYSGTTVLPSYTVCFVEEEVSKQGFSGFAKPDEYVTDIDYVNVGDIVSGGVVKDSAHGAYLGYNYPYKASSKTRSTVVRYVLKTGDFEGNPYSNSFMTVDIGGNCGSCRSYVGSPTSIMFAWDIEGCTNTTKNYTFESNSWYAVEQGRVRVASGINKGKDYVYIKINDQIVSAFYGNANSRPLTDAAQEIYIEANGCYEIVGYNELRAKYYVDGSLYLNQLAQKGFNVIEPAAPEKKGSYFVGWYTEKTGGKLFDFKNTKLTGNINLYARFTTESVKAVFNNNDGVLLSDVTIGKGCLVPQPSTPTYSGNSPYEQVFAGWKNETTGKLFDFETGRISTNTTFTAQYKEKEYDVSYYANGTLVKKVPFVLSNPTVSGKEPAVPSVPNATGVWENHATTGLTKSITVNAVYTVKTPSASTAIKLNTYAGGKIYLNTDTVHNYLSTGTAKEQSVFVREFISSEHEYQDHQNTSFKWTDSGKNSKYTVYFADNKEFKNAYIVTTAKTSLVNAVGIFIPGKTYYWYVCGNTTGKCSAVDTFKIVDTPVRYITAGKVTNMRDEGGYMTQDGSKVKYGLVYRGAALDEGHSYVDDAARNVFRYLGMKSEIELRGGYQHDYTGWDENNANSYYIAASGYSDMVKLDNNLKSQYKAVFEAMADESNYPFYFHCSAGADRTGAFGYLLNGLLGVPYEDLRKDYELTSFSEVGLRAADENGDDSFDKMHNLILEQYGDGSGNVQAAIQKYLTSYIGVDEAVLESIKNIMLEKNAVPNEKPYTITVDILGEKRTYQAFDGIYFMPESPKAIGKLFKGFYNGSTKYNGYAKSDLTLTAKFEDIEFEPYDTITLKDLGITKNQILNQTNTTYTYKKTAKTGGRLFRFILEPIGDMKNGDGPQLALTNDWNLNRYACAWFQSGTMSYVYYKGDITASPDISKLLTLESGKEYKIEFAVRIMKNKGYEGKKIFEITVNGELLVQYIGCKAPLDDNKIFFHGSTGAAYLKNWPVYKTVNLYVGDKLYQTVKAERSGLLPQVEAPGPKNGVPFAGWYTAKTGGTLWDENADKVYKNLNLYAHFADVKTVTAIVDGKTLTYRIPTGETLKSIPIPKKQGMVFSRWLLNGKPFTGKVTKNITITAAFEQYQYDDYDELTLKDLGIQQNSIPNQTNTVYTYNKTAKTGGRVLQFILIPTENMSDGPQVALTNDWNLIRYATVWFQSNTETHIYYKGELDSPPDLSKQISLEAGKEYEVKFSVRVLKNKGYEGTKVFEVSINGQTLIQYAGCKADLSNNVFYFHGGTGTATLKNWPVYETVKLYNGDKLYKTVQVERSGLLPKVKDPSPKNGLPFAGWYTAKSGGTLWDENADVVLKNMSLYAHFANVKVINAIVDGKKLTYRVEVGKTLDELPKPQKAGHVFAGWLVNGKPFTGKVTSNMTVTASFEAYSFDDYDEISLRDLGIYTDLNFNDLGDTHIADYTYRKAAKTGGRVFKAIYVPTKDMLNGPQVSFSPRWDENYFAKLYFLKSDQISVYSSGIDGGLPTFTMDTELVGGKQYLFEIGVRVLNNKGYEGVKVLTVSLNGKLVFEEFDNRANINDAIVFFQGMPDTGLFRNVNIYKTVSFYDGNKLLSSVKVLRGKMVNSIGNLADQGDYLFKGWFTEFGEEWDFDTSCVYLDTVLKAKYEKRTYPVLLMVDDVLYKQLNAFAGECMNVYDIPEKDGWEFETWLYEDGTAYDSLTPVNGPITLYARFKESSGSPVKDNAVKPVAAKKTDSHHNNSILFMIIGLIVIAGETTGIIIDKKRTKR